MWKLTFLFFLLLCSTAFAAEGRGQFQVGIIITGTSSTSTVGHKTGAGSVAKSAAPAPGLTGNPAAARPHDATRSVP